MYRTAIPVSLVATTLLAVGCKWSHLHGHYEGDVESVSTLDDAKAHRGPLVVDLKRDDERVEMSLWGCSFAATMTGTAEAELVEGQRCDDPLTGAPLTWTGRVGTNRSGALLEFELEGRPDHGPGAVKATFTGRRS
jgi:hypothetical protein